MRTEWESHEETTRNARDQSDLLDLSAELTLSDVPDRILVAIEMLHHG